MTILRTDEGKKIVLSNDDRRLYKSPVNPPNTGTSYTRGKDLYLHISRNKNEYFYFYFWSMWQGEENSCQLCSKDEAKDFLLNKAGLSGWGALSDSELVEMQDIFPDILEEDA